MCSFNHGVECDHHGTHSMLFVPYIRLYITYMADLHMIAYKFDASRSAPRVSTNGHAAGAS